MLNCAKTFSQALILGLLLVSPSAIAWDSLRSDFLIFNEVVPVDRTWLRMQAGESTALSYDAGLAPSGEVPRECQWSPFSASHSTLEIGERTRAYLEKCENQIKRSSWGWLENYYRTMFVRIKLSEHPYMKRVLLRLPKGYQQPGLLALKDLKTRRPLIIFRAGIFGNSIDIQAERHLIMQLFEQGPFNLLFLDSLTSPESIKWNVRYSAGGFDEGLQSYQIAERLTQSKEPISHLISGIHLLAVSMGGHGVWMSLALNEVNKPLFRSAVAFCPLVEFEKTFREHQDFPVGFFFMNVWTYFRLGLLRDRVPNLSMSRFLLDSFESVSKNYPGPLTDDGKLQFPQAKGFNKSDYFGGNNLAALIPMISTPVTVFSTEKDSLVPFETNFGALSKYSQGHKNFHLFKLSEGAHCANPGAYDWDEFSKMVKDQFVDREPDLWSKAHQVVQPISVPKSEVPENADLLIQASVGENHLKVSFMGPNQNKISTQIPIQKLDWGVSELIRSESEARALIRWARANIRLEREPAPQLVWMNLKKDF